MTSQPESIGRYHIIREISRSEIAVVYQALDPRLDREVAIKLVLPGRELSKEFQDNFRRASKDLAQLSHANIIKVLDFGEQDGSPFIVMDYLAAGSLADRIGQPMRWQEAVRLIIPVAGALAYAHGEHLIHRDLKPSNILFTVENQPIITDLNFVDLVEDEETRDFTSTTVGLGLPEYMSPEQGKGLNVDHRADIYSLGIIFYEMITGRKPFESDNPMEVVIRQVTTPPPDPRGIIPDLPSGLVQIMMKALSKDPEQRYPDMVYFTKDLEKILRKKGGAADPQTNRPFRHLSIGAVLALVITSVFVGFGWQKWIRSSDLPQSEPTIPAQFSSELETSTPTAVSSLGSILPTATPTLEPSAPAIEASPTADTLPRLPGQELPVPSTALVPENTMKMVELARWGTPKFNQIVWSPDSEQLIAATSNGIYFYTADNLKLLRFVDLQAWMTALDVSKNGKLVAAGDNNGLVHVLDYSSGESLLTLQGHTAEITSLAFSPDASLLLSGSKDHTALLWDVENGTLLHTLKGHLLTVNTVSFSGDGQVAMTGSEDFLINLWDITSGTKIKTLTGSSQINQLVISPDQKMIATAQRNSTAQLWDIEAGISKNILQDKKLVLEVNAISFSANGQMILSGAADSSIRLWQAATGDELWKASGAKNPEKINKASDAILSLAFSPDGNRFLSATRGGYLAIWDLGTKSVIHSQNYEWQEINRLEFSPQTKYLALQISDNQVEVLNLVDGSLKLSAPGVLARGNPFSEQGDQIAILSADDKISIHTLDKDQDAMVLHGYSTGASVSFLPGGKFIGASTNKKVILWSLNSGQELEFRQSGFNGNCQVIYDANGSFLTAGSKMGLIQSPDTLNGFCNISHSYTMLDEDYLPSGDTLAVATNNQKVILWDHLAAEGIQSSFIGHAGKVLGVRLAQNQRLMATAGEDHKVLLWDPIDEKKPLRVLENHYDAVLDVVFSADSKYLATSSLDGAVQIWGIYP